MKKQYIPNPFEDTDQTEPVNPTPAPLKEPEKTESQPQGQGHVAPRVEPSQASPRMSTSSYSSFRRRRGTQKLKQRSPKDSGLYLPVWSLAVMLVGVLIVSAVIVLFVIGIGGGNPEEEAQPIVRVITSVPLDSEPAAEAFAPPTTAPIIQNTQPTPGSFTIQGPTLEPIGITPTRETLAVGKTIVVVDVGSSGLNVRDTAGITNTTVLFIGDEGEQFSILEGPTQADGLVWWRIQNPSNPERSGWAAAQYLEVAPTSP